MEDEAAITVEHVSKDFVLPHQRANSIKSLFTGSVHRSGTKRKETQHALKDISFEIRKGEFFGIVGRNGSGKTTMLKILANIYQPTKGRVVTRGKLVPFIELGVGFNPELTGRENVYLNGAMLGFSRKEVDAMYDDIVSFAELERFMDQKLKNYSSGMQVRLAFSVATRAKADILLIDEVLAVGDADFQRKCFNYFKGLKKNGTTVVFVSHDMGAVKEFCDRAVLIDKSHLVEEGSPQRVADKYTQLFNESTDTKKPAEQNRWGTGDVRYSSVEATLEGEDLLIKAKAQVHKPVETLLFGWHITGRDGADIFAANNRMYRIDDFHDLESGDEVALEWRIFNVLGDGSYDVTLTLADSVSTVYDWYYEAASFVVRRKKRTTTAVFPPTKVETKLLKGGTHAKKD